MMLKNITFVLVSSFALILTGCGGGSGGSEDDTETEASDSSGEAGSDVDTIMSNDVLFSVLNNNGNFWSCYNSEFQRPQSAYFIDRLGGGVEVDTTTNKVISGSAFTMRQTGENSIELTSELMGTVALSSIVVFDSGVFTKSLITFSSRDGVLSCQEELMVVEENPDVWSRLRREAYVCFFSDISDLGIFYEFRFDRELLLERLGVPGTMAPEAVATRGTDFTTFGSVEYSLRPLSSGQQSFSMRLTELLGEAPTFVPGATPGATPTIDLGSTIEFFVSFTDVEFGDENINTFLATFNIERIDDSNALEKIEDGEIMDCTRLGQDT